MNRIALIPAYEPGQVLNSLLQELRENNFTVIVVDDGSGKAFSSVFEEAADYATVLSYPENHGKGYAMKTGFQYIKDRYPDSVIVTLDSDGQHLVSDAIRLLSEAEHFEGLVLGSRHLPKDAPFKSRFGNAVTRAVFRFSTGVSVYDTQTGLRAFSSALLPTLLAIPGDRYEYEMNVLLSFARNHIPIRELTIQTIYLDKTNSVSHFNALKDSFKIYKEILKFSASSLLGFLVDYGCYALFLHLGLSLIVSNYSARVISSVFNFLCNKLVVFKTHGHTFREGAQYFALALFNITLDSLLLSGLTALGLNEYIGKLIVEILMFGISYTVQHFFIFKKK